MLVQYDEWKLCLHCLWTKCSNLGFFVQVDPHLYQVASIKMWQLTLLILPAMQTLKSWFLCSSWSALVFCQVASNTTWQEAMIILPMMQMLKSWFLCSSALVRWLLTRGDRKLCLHCLWLKCQVLVSLSRLIWTCLLSGGFYHYVTGSFAYSACDAKMQVLVSRFNCTCLLSGGFWHEVTGSFAYIACDSNIKSWFLCPGLVFCQVTSITTWQGALLILPVIQMSSLAFFVQVDLHLSFVRWLLT